MKMNSTTSVNDSANNFYNPTFPSKALQPTEIKVFTGDISFAFKIVYIAIGAVGIVGNLLALIVFLGHKPLLKRPANYFLVSQCAINFLVSIMLILTMVVDASHWPASVVVPMCYLWNSRAIFAGLFLSSLNNITLVTVERYLEIVHPIKHHLKISKRKVISSIVVGTLAGVIFKVCISCPTMAVVKGICTHINYPTIAAKRVTGTANFFVEYFIHVVVIAFCYASMARSLRRNSKVIQMVSGESLPIGTKTSRARRNIMKMLFNVVLGFVICTTFKQFLLLLNFFRDLALDLSGITFNVAQVLAYLNCCNDPFIYAFHYEEFRVGLRRLFSRVQVMPTRASTTNADDTQLN